MSLYLENVIIKMLPKLIALVRGDFYYIVSLKGRLANDVTLRSD